MAERWNIPGNVAKEICRSYKNGDSIFYLNDYQPSICAHLDLASINDVYNFLGEISSLAPKKKRLINALKKADKYSETLENRIRLCTSSIELDDMLLPHRPNPRSRAQLACNKGLGELADIFHRQEVEEGSVEAVANESVGKDVSLKSIDDVISGLKDILVERFAYDETVRSMVRDFGFDDGFFEVIPRNKKDREFVRYRGKMIPINELEPEQILYFLEAEESKRIRFKHDVQLFRITELLRHHFIINPDFFGIDLICEVIDECWNRLLQPMVEHFVKERVRKEAQDWAIRKIEIEIDKRIQNDSIAGTILSAGIEDGEWLAIVAFNPEGHLLGATKEKVHNEGKEFFSKRLMQFYSRYKSGIVVIHDNEFVSMAEKIVIKTLGKPSEILRVVKNKINEGQEGLAGSGWIKDNCSDLDTDMKKIYSLGLLYAKPLSIIPQIGVQFFNLHPLQKIVNPEKISELIERKITEQMLHKGIICVDIAGSAISKLPNVNEKVLLAIRNQAAKRQIATKRQLLNVEGMTETVYKNIAGYLVFPYSDNLLDRTTIHPYHSDWVIDMAQQMNISLETLVNNPEQLRSIKTDDFEETIFIERKVICQLQTGQKYFSSNIKKPSRRHYISEIQEGAILSGRVTNITPFGVFVDINATCDGLIHISQLADGYVETADQVVKLNDRVDVRVLMVDKKKKRISLSMKNLGDKGPKIRPSKGQLSNLADHFKNR